MKTNELQTLLDKISRLRTRFSDASGIKTQEWSARTEDGDEMRVTLVGAKDLADLQIDIEAAFVWIWSLKDYVKRYARQRGTNEGAIETRATASKSLSICADIANCLKHGGTYSKRH